MIHDKTEFYYKMESIKSSIDCYDEFQSRDEYDNYDSTNSEIQFDKICSYILELILKNDVVNSKDIIKYIDSKDNISINNFLHYSVLKNKNHDKLKNHKDEKSFQIFFGSLELKYNSIGHFDYKDYEFYDFLSKLSKTCSIMLVFVNDEMKRPCVKILINNEIKFLMNYYQRNWFEFLTNKTGENKFLEYFEEVCRTTDFSGEYK